ncbi:MAG: hypothetical protein KF886_25195 [Candidatus Hydrogenedentes bacterium]|nr:hypothetical protein [Candidatus Hydrogenedentota bacterium]
MKTDFTILRQLLQYELYGAQRHRRFVSMVMITTEEGISGLRNFLSSHIRDSDVIADFDSSIAVLMGETDINSAMVAVNRYKSFFDSQLDLRFSVVTYPSDGGKAENLIKMAYRRLSQARQGDTGAVITSG